MQVPNKIYRSLKTQGVLGTIIYVLENKFQLRLPLGTKLRWRLGIRNEILFWDKYFKEKGLQWSANYHLRLDPTLQLQENISKLIPEDNETVDILDVGAGPLTYLGKVYENKIIKITAVDPLAKEYDKLLEKYSVDPLVRTEELEAEKLTKRFEENSFDLVFARNCIDHSFSPEKAILEMIKVCKRKCYILMMHIPNEAENENYKGLHQWNFSSDNGEFIISSKNDKVNFSDKFSHLCKAKCIITDDGWLRTEIRKE